VSHRGDCDCEVGRERVVCGYCKRTVERRSIGTKKLVEGEWVWACDVCPYWTVVVPYAPPALTTEWHPTVPAGPFSVLTRGAFRTQGLAIEWAEKHLGAAPFSTRLIGAPS